MYGGLRATGFTDPVKGLLRLWSMKWKDAPVPSSSRGRGIGRSGGWGDRATRAKEVSVFVSFKIAVLTQGDRLGALYYQPTKPTELYVRYLPLS